MNSKPLLIIIQGAPGVGKTTLAHKLKRDLDCGIVASDDVKEYFFDTIGVGDMAWSATLGKTLKPMCYALVDVALRHNKSLIFEAAFWPEYAKQDMSKLLERNDVRAVEIYCHVDEVTRLERYNKKVADGSWHIGHGGMPDQVLERERYQPIDVCERIDYDTAGSSEEYATLLKLLRDKMPRRIEHETTN